MLLAIVVALFSWHHERSREPAAAIESNHVAVVVASHVGRDAGMIPHHAGGLRLEGLVLDDLDHPVVDALIRPSRWIRSSAEPQRGEEVRSGADGTFAIEGLEPDTYYLAARKDDDLFSAVEQVFLTTSSEPIVMRLHGGTSLSVHAIDENTRLPIAGIAVSCWSIETFSDETGATRHVITDAAGVARCRGLGVGWLIRIGSSDPAYEPREISSVTDADPAFNTVTLALGRGAAISGTVRDSKNQPISSATVRCGSRFGDQHTQTDAQGHWELASVARGRHKLVATAHDRQTELMLDLDGQRRDGVDIVVVGPAREKISGIVTDSNGAPVADASVYVHQDPHVSDQVKSDAEGKFSAAMPPGDATVTASTSDSACDPVAVVVSAHAGPIHLVVRPTIIEGVVIDQHGKTVARAELVLEGNRTQSDANGRFSFRGSTPGPHQIGAAAPEFRTAIEQWRLDTSFVTWTTVASGDRDVKVVVSRSVSVVGRLELAAQPVANFAVRVQPDRGEDHREDVYDRVVHSIDGQFSIPLPPGTWAIAFAGDGFQRKELEHVVIGVHDRDLGAVVVERGQQIAGTVSDSRGSPIAGALVTVGTGDDGDTFSHAYRAMNGAAITRSDANGGYELAGITPSPDNYIIASHPTYGASRPVKLTATSTHVDLSIVTTGTIEGVIDRAEVSSVALASVVDRGYEHQALIDRANGFSFQNVPAGEYTLSLGYHPFMPQRVTVTAGQTTRVEVHVPTKAIEVIVDKSKACQRIEIVVEGLLDVVRSEPCTVTGFMLVPGKYAVCLDGDCTPIVVAEAPDEQAFHIP